MARQMGGLIDGWHAIVSVQKRGITVGIRRHRRGGVSSLWMALDRHGPIRGGFLIHRGGGLDGLHGLSLALFLFLMSPKGWKNAFMAWETYCEKKGVQKRNEEQKRGTQAMPLNALANGEGGSRETKGGPWVGRRSCSFLLACICWSFGYLVPTLWLHPVM